MSRHSLQVLARISQSIHVFRGFLIEFSKRMECQKRQGIFKVLQNVFRKTGIYSRDECLKIHDHVLGTQSLVVDLLGQIRLIFRLTDSFQNPDAGHGFSISFIMKRGTIRVHAALFFT